MSVGFAGASSTTTATIDRCDVRGPERHPPLLAQHRLHRAVQAGPVARDAESPHDPFQREAEAVEERSNRAVRRFRRRLNAFDRFRSEEPVGQQLHRLVPVSLATVAARVDGQPNFEDARRKRLARVRAGLDLDDEPTLVLDRKVQTASPDPPGPLESSAERIGNGPNLTRFPLSSMTDSVSTPLTVAPTGSSRWRAHDAAHGGIRDRHPDGSRERQGRLLRSTVTWQAAGQDRWRLLIRQNEIPARSAARPKKIAASYHWRGQ